jgi:formylglycine-generating enzyme required for sulfatase activity
LTRSWSSCQTGYNKRKTLSKTIPHLFRRSWHWLTGHIRPYAAPLWVLLGLLLLAFLAFALLQRDDWSTRERHTPVIETNRAETATAQALLRFENSCQPDRSPPGQGEASPGCAQAAQAAITGIPFADLAGEQRLLRWLAVDNPQALAAALDRAVLPIPAGPFEMGSETGREDERPVRRVTLDAYSIDRYEVTNSQYTRFVAATGRRPPRYWIDGDYPPGLADSPVVGVSWQDALDYCAWAGKRLPSEAEWEKACRGTEGRLYPWGNNWRADDLNVTEACLVPGSQYLEALWPVLQTLPGSGQAGLFPVGSFPQGISPYGALDMAGNAAEWVKDWYNSKAYQILPQVNPLSQEPPWNHSVRSSAWWILPKGQAGAPGSTAAFESRCTARNGSHSADDPRLGFRCSR